MLPGLVVGHEDATTDEMEANAQHREVQRSKPGQAELNADLQKAKSDIDRATVFLQPQLTACNADRLPGRGAMTRLLSWP